MILEELYDKPKCMVPIKGSRGPKGKTRRESGVEVHQGHPICEERPSPNEVNNGEKRDGNPLQYPIRQPAEMEETLYKYPQFSERG